MTKEIDTMQDITEFGEHLIDARAGEPVTFFAEEGAQSILVPTNNLSVEILIGCIAAFSKPRALEELVGHTLKSRHDNDDPISPCPVEDYACNFPDALGCGD
jgi:hypothetical protein